MSETLPFKWTKQLKELIPNQTERARLRTIIENIYGRGAKARKQLLELMPNLGTGGMIGPNAAQKLLDSGLVNAKGNVDFLKGLGSQPGKKQPDYPGPPGGDGDGKGGDIDWLLNRYLGNFTIPLPNPNDWQPYEPMQGRSQPFMPWDPIAWTADPSIQGTQPTFQGGTVLPPPAPPDLQPWPDFPIYQNPYPEVPLNLVPDREPTGGGTKGPEGGGPETQDTEGISKPKQPSTGGPTLPTLPEGPPPPPEIPLPPPQAPPPMFGGGGGAPGPEIMAMLQGALQQPQMPMQQPQPPQQPPPLDLMSLLQMFGGMR